jgi:hypothetical protein
MPVLGARRRAFARLASAPSTLADQGHNPRDCVKLSRQLFAGTAGFGSNGGLLKPACK